MTLIKKKLVLKAKPKPQTPKDRLVELITKAIKNDPFEYDDHVWCAMPQADLAACVGVSVRTLRDLTKEPPIVRDRAQDRDGKQVAILRIGEFEKTKKQVQKHLVNIFRQETGRTLVGENFGVLGGLVDAWGLDDAPDIFRLVLRNWPAFVAGAHIEIEQLGDEGYKRFYKYPSPTFILRFNSVGKEMALMAKQEKMVKQATAKSKAPLPIVF